MTTLAASLASSGVYHCFQKKQSNPEAYLNNKTCFNVELVPSAKSICHFERSFEPRRADTLKNSPVKKS